MECTICGKETDKLNKAMVEGSLAEVCDKCVKFGELLFKPTSYKPIKRKIELKEPEEEIISDYGKLVTKARSSKGLTREAFAKRISEKESTIRRIEEERMEPDDKLIKKIENFLSIQLTQHYKEELKHKDKKKNSELTVGDIAELR